MSSNRWFPLFVLAVLAGLAAGVPVQAEPAKGKRYALLVGVREYSRATFTSLKFTEADVEELGRTLTQLGSGFAKVRLLTTTRGEKNPRDRPTAANIGKALQELLAGKEKNDTVLIALSGHGVQLELEDPSGKGQTKSYSYFCPSDADLAGVSYRTGFSKTLVNLGSMLSSLGRCGAGTKLVLIDACRNELKAQAATRNIDPEQVTVPRGVGALFSCASGQRSFETAKLGHGVFFHYVLEGLKGDGRNRRGAVTWDSLAEYVKDKVSTEVGQIVGGNARQTPHEVRNLAGSALELVGPAEVRAFKGHAGWAYRLALVPGGKHVVSSGDYLHVWELETGKEVRRFAPGNQAWGLTVSRDGKHVLAGQRDNSVRLYELATGKEVHKLVKHTGLVWVAHLSPDGRHAVTGGQDRTLLVWDVQTGKLVRSFENVTDFPRCAAFSPDGKQIAVGHFSMKNKDWGPATVRIWDVETGKLLRSSAPLHTRPITAVSWSRNGRWIASSSFDGMVRVWETKGLKEVRHFLASSVGSDGVVFTPDSRRLVTAGWTGDNTVRVWDLATAQLMQRFDGHTGSALSLAVTADGRHALSSATDGTLRMWLMPR